MADRVALLGVGAALPPQIRSSAEVEALIEGGVDALLVETLHTQYQDNHHDTIDRPRSFHRHLWIDIHFRRRAARASSGAGTSGRAASSSAGSRTTTGQPLLANDPHLGMQIPALWYFDSLHCQPVSAECPFDVIGASLPGVPGIVIGHNARIAWGVTNVGPDVQDLFIEKVNNDTNKYEYKGQQLDLQIVPSTWTITGKVPDGYKPSLNEVDEYDAASNTTKITLNVRYTRHGPLISDVNTDAAKLDEPVSRA